MYRNSLLMSEIDRGRNSSIIYACEPSGITVCEYVHRCTDLKSTRLNSSHANISYAVFCLKKSHQVIRVERPPDRRPGIGGHPRRHPSAQSAVAVKMSFHLDHQRHAARDQRTEIAKRHHPLRRVLEGCGL